ncbi:uncharacterized protein K452DRAFT_292054 [Aplosporella prunicola CBS 121167]|uniref:Uncharacterized protein n=1 Tax=Aplosporella prunicola CBS 121167 TaxID=1176127 RepID=A0A6A6AY02_9PEZI|nr:uncharacterized protein K452DRAFT_292054 [Aplosporella prunicola CBS 121167]KAF2136819.1 hypothetical protein K452DRAFT_292054 [Aplosporella prunicola CBS 121167]
MWANDGLMNECQSPHHPVSPPLNTSFSTINHNRRPQVSYRFHQMALITPHQTPCTTHQTTRKKTRNSKTKGVHPRPPKTSRKEVPPATRAFLTGAALMGGISLHEFSRKTGIPLSTISGILTRAQERAKKTGVPLWQPYCYGDGKRGRGVKKEKEGEDG